MTWSEINASADLALAGADVYDIGIDLSRPDMVFAALSPYGIVCSTNGGIRLEGTHSGDVRIGVQGHPPPHQERGTRHAPVRDNLREHYEIDERR